MNKEKIIMLLKAYREFTGDSRIANECGEAIEALHQAHAQGEQDMYTKQQNINKSEECVHKTEKIVHQWKGMTDDDVIESAECMEAIDPTSRFWREFAHIIEAKLREKNNG